VTAGKMGRELVDKWYGAFGEGYRVAEQRMPRVRN
jgi:hypothetical protein